MEVSKRFYNQQPSKDSTYECSYSVGFWNFGPGGPVVGVRLVAQGIRPAQGLEIRMSAQEAEDMAAYLNKYVKLVKEHTK